PVLSITFLSLSENNQTTSTIYSKLCPYNFRVKVIDSVSINDLEKVYLTLDPEGSNIQLSWDRATGQFVELSDSNNYVSINSSSKGNNYYNIWTIDFNLEFNWNYPDEDLHNVQSIATSATLSPSWFNITGFYDVENDIVFDGVSIIRDEENRILAQNELVRGGEKLTWTGLTPVYEGTIDVYPSEDEFNIAICDDYDNIWVCSPNSSEQFYTEVFTPNTTFSSYNYTLSICGIPPECDNTSEMFTLRIDADNLTFSEIIPNEILWQTIDDVTVGVTITDIGGGVVNSSTVMYAISRNNGTSWDAWETVPNLDSAISIEVKDIVSLRDGKNNLIKWKAADSVGNGPIESEPSRILVDTEGISFYNAWPMATAVSTSELVELGITVADGISGVNASTLKYSISTDRGNTWDTWVPVEGYEDSIK
ncbi:MAG: hypothetical protein KAJ51_17555, partial [Thermoplasmata archaeon]|nr:hypothetical protein [Thermoplasmata archaeon]